MEFGLDKCAKIVFKRGKLVQSQNLILDSTEKCRSSNREKHTIPRDWKKWGYVTSTNEREIEEGIHQEIKNDTEIQVKWQEYNYTNSSFSCSNIKVQFWYY